MDYFCTKGGVDKIAKTKRSDNSLEVINKDYKDAGIEIAEWSED